MRKAFVIGVGMTKFLKPGSHSQSYIDLSREAILKAIHDSNVEYKEIDHAFVGYIFQQSCAGQRVIYEAGMTGIPVVNVNNNCATGSTAFNLAYNFVQSGISECSIAVGFDVMQKGSLPLDSSTSSPTYEYQTPIMESGKWIKEGPPAPQLFGHAGREHMEKYGSNKDHFSKISVKNYKHGSNNPYAQFQTTTTIDKVNNSTLICSPLTKLHCCPTSDGAASVIVCSEDFMKKHKLENQAIEILASVLQTDCEDTFESKSMIDRVGYQLAKRTAEKALKKANIKIEEVGAIELHDCFAANELLTYEALGLCEQGKGGDFVDRGDNTYGGKYVINPSGGLTSKGHPLGATGLAQITELTWQLRGMADKRQISNLKYALAHNLGLGSAIIVTILKKFNETKDNKKTSSHPSVIEIKKVPKPKF